ncbi:MAG: GerW family sporulation protein [Clostridia bacterium]|nr:GerW family sporulation protein [Clostridia bacterium]
MEQNNTNKKPENGRRGAALEHVMETSIQNVKSMLDANTVIGDPITTPDGTVILPVSKISVGFVSGGSDFATKTNPKLCFGGGSGAGVTINPVSFLVISPTGTVNVLPANQSSASAIDKVIDLAPGVIEKVKGIFKKDKDEESEFFGEE